MITEVRQSGLPTAALIHSISWRASHRDFCSPEFVALHTPEHQLKYLEHELKSGKKLYMLDEGAPVGIVTVWGDLIENLYVLPAFQRRGFGSRLLEFAAERCEGAPRLWVLDNNAPALALYTGRGFTPTGARHELTATIAELELIRENPSPPG